jgi:hypothetical protein
LDVCDQGNAAFCEAKKGEANNTPPSESIHIAAHWRGKRGSKSNGRADVLPVNQLQMSGSIPVSAFDKGKN